MWVPPSCSLYRSITVGTLTEASIVKLVYGSISDTDLVLKSRLSGSSSQYISELSDELGQSGFSK
jgi:hypothetical protein